MYTVYTIHYTNSLRFLVQSKMIERKKKTSDAELTAHDINHLNLQQVKSLFLVVLVVYSIALT